MFSSPQDVHLRGLNKPPFKMWRDFFSPSRIFRGLARVTNFSGGEFLTPRQNSGQQGRKGPGVFMYEMMLVRIAIILAVKDELQLVEKKSTF